VKLKSFINLRDLEKEKGRRLREIISGNSTFSDREKRMGHGILSKVDGAHKSQRTCADKAGGGYLKGEYAILTSGIASRVITLIRGEEKRTQKHCLSRG